jgi:hypothetical protein
VNKEAISNSEFQVALWTRGKHDALACTRSWVRDFESYAKLFYLKIVNKCHLFLFFPNFMSLQLFLCPG